MSHKSLAKAGFKTITKTPARTVGTVVVVGGVVVGGVMLASWIIGLILSHLIFLLIVLAGVGGATLLVKHRSRRQIGQ
jgi:hypothetical protein